MKKQQESTLYLAYGSNLNLPQMQTRCPTAYVVGRTEIPNHRLVFRGAAYGAVATIEPCEGKSVPVLLWKLNPMDELALDRYEGYPRFYGKTDHTVEVNGKAISAMVYEMTPGHTLGIPSRGYFNTIREGYQAAGFDMAVLDEAVEYTMSQMAQERREYLYGEEPEPVQEEMQEDTIEYEEPGFWW